MDTNIRAVETRSIEDSLSHGHEAICRAERLASLILDDLNGPSPASTEPDGGNYGGVVSSTDRLAGRIDSLCRDLERARSRIISDSPAKAPAMAYAGESSRRLG